MAKTKRNTRTAPAAAPVAAPAPVVAVGVASTATQLTKRNGTPLNAPLHYTGKPLRMRAAHVTDAWAAVSAMLPATAAQLATLPALAHPACVSPQAWLSYMVRRGYLQAK
jgi:hypothetical protein